MQWKPLVARSGLCRKQSTSLSNSLCLNVVILDQRQPPDLFKRVDHSRVRVRPAIREPYNEPNAADDGNQPNAAGDGNRQESSPCSYDGVSTFGFHFQDPFAL